MSIQVGNYTYLQNELLGIGPYSKIFKGKDNLGRTVAIKVISKLILNIELKESLIEELEQLLQLEHPKILKTLDLVQTENNYYVIQEYSSGTDLQKRISRGKLLTESECIVMIEDILEAFTDLIPRGIIHKDLKPTNVFIEDGHYKISDVGLAYCIENFKKHEVQGQTGQLYKSIQILKDQTYKSNCDIWSIGVLAFTSMHGYTPWFAQAKEDLIKDIENQQLMFSKNIQISTQLKDFIVGCLVLDDKQRLTWDKIFDMPIIHEHFTRYYKQVRDDKMKFLMNHLRKVIMKEQISIVDLFNELDVSKDRQLDFTELSKLLTFVDPKMLEEDMIYIFNKVDSDGSGQISFEEFSKWMKDYDIDIHLLHDRRKKPEPSSGKPITMVESVVFMPPPQQTDPYQQQKIQQSVYTQPQLEQLKQYLIYGINQYNMLDIFRRFDRDMDKFLSAYEFINLLQAFDQRIDPQLAKAFYRYISPKEELLSFIQFRCIFQLQKSLFQNSIGYF